MTRERRGRMAIRLSTELQTALALSAEKSGLPIATQAMLLLRQALARTMESKEYAERLGAARRDRTRGDFLADMANAAEGLGLEQEGQQGGVQQGAEAQAAGPVQA